LSENVTSSKLLLAQLALAQLTFALGLTSWIQLDHHGFGTPLIEPRLEARLPSKEAAYSP
jgi:uncharacterized membrane protein